jgi:hypothetical protein
MAANRRSAVDVDLDAVEARLRAMLEPYVGRLEWATIYGLPTLRRPGARAHDWFAFVKPAARHVSLFLLPVHTHADLLEGCSPALLARKSGASTFAFTTLPDGLASELESLLERAFRVYAAASGLRSDATSTDRGRDTEKGDSALPSR